MTHRHKDAVPGKRPRLEIVLKADSVGSVEAVVHAVSEIAVPGIEIGVIHSGVGAVTKSDLLLAETAGRLVVGFQVDVVPGMERVLKEHRVEIRRYEVIYRLTGDIQAIAESLVLPIPQEQVIGSAKVIALFKSSRKGIIIGCEVLDGFLALGGRFRIISAMGPVYSGIFESIHIGKITVQRATPGQQVGIKIRDFNKVKIGDLVESFRPSPPKARIWEPVGQIVRK